MRRVAAPIISRVSGARAYRSMASSRHARPSARMSQFIIAIPFSATTIASSRLWNQDLAGPTRTR